MPAVASCSPENSPILRVRDLRVSYGKCEVVHGVSFDLPVAGIVGIVGESGSGKSTLAKALMRLNPVAGGEISYPRTQAPRPSMQMIFQDAVGSLNPRMTVSQTLNEVIRHCKSRYTPADLLSRVGLSEAVLSQYPRELSGGQCQRVSIARALATAPDILIADEPVSALDVSVQARVLNLLRDLRRDLQLSILLIAHDLAVVRNICDFVCVMEKGVFVDAGPADDVFGNPQSPYTRRLLSAVPEIKRR